MKKKCKKKTMKNYIAILAAVLIPVAGYAQTALQGFSGTGSTNATGPSLNTNISWVIVPKSLTDIPVVTYVEAWLQGSESTNASASVNFYRPVWTGDRGEIKVTGTTATGGTNVTVAATSTNGIAIGDVFVLWDAQTDAYYRLSAHTPSSSTLNFLETINVQTDSNDRLYKVALNGRLRNPSTAPLSGQSKITGSGTVFIGVSGRPILVEAFGTNIPSLNIITARGGLGAQ